MYLNSSSSTLLFGKKNLHIKYFMKLPFHVATYVDFSLGNANWEP
jgi:hypothetical protein